MLRCMVRRNPILANVALVAGFWIFSRACRECVMSERPYSTFGRKQTKYATLVSDWFRKGRGCVEICRDVYAESAMSGGWGQLLDRVGSWFCAGCEKELLGFVFIGIHQTALFLVVEGPVKQIIETFWCPKGPSGSVE
eukprot:scaffold17233_cov87-Cylindrotheca_fusiformis.AAC.3